LAKSWIERNHKPRELDVMGKARFLVRARGSLAFRAYPALVATKCDQRNKDMQ
jgi:hypothetical protein